MQKIVVELRANTVEEIVEMSKQHCVEMFQRNDEAHLAEMQEMQEMQQLMQKPGAMSEWFESKRKEFEARSES